MPSRKQQTAVRPRCRHCDMRMATRLRAADGHYQLCEKCWDAPGIRARFLPDSPYAKRGRRHEGDFGEDKALDLRPLDTHPLTTAVRYIRAQLVRRLTDAKRASEKVCLVRQGQRLTPAAFAVLLGVTEATVQRWEHGQQAPSPDHLVAMAGRFNLPVSCFFPGLDARAD